MRLLAAMAALAAISVPSVGPGHPGPNLLSNGGFELGEGGGPKKDEAGVGVGWEAICGGSHPEIYSLDRRVRHSGRFSQRMSCSGYRFHEAEGGGYCYSILDGREVRHPVNGIRLGNQAIAQTTQPGAVKPGKSYRLSAWVKIQDLSAKWEWFRLGIYWLDKEGRFISESRESDADKTNTGTHDWKLLSVTGRAPEGAAFAKAYLHHHFEHGVVWYDDVALTAEPR